MEGMMDAIAERVQQGGAISDADARTILQSHDLIAVGMMADDARRRVHGIRTTFVRVFEVHVDAVPTALPEKMTAGEIRIVGRPASVAVAVAASQAVARLAGRVPVSGFSLADLKGLSGSTLAEICSALAQAGLEMIAEVPVDAAGIGPADVEAARHAGLTLARMTVSELRDEQRIDIIARARDLQAAVGGFRAFAPLPRTMSVAAPSTGYHDVKQVALARLLAANIDSIQVDWPLYGPKLAQVALTVGADDVDGIAAVEAGILGTRRSAIEEIRGNIRAASLEAVERDARWESLEA
jgi:aminodeoxyfutalosine synthase